MLWNVHYLTRGAGGEAQQRSYDSIEIITPIYAERETVLATVCHLLWGVLISASYIGCQLDLEVIDILVA